MLKEFYTAFAQTNTWETILPEIAVAMLALVLLGAEMLLPRRRWHLIPKLALFGQIAILLVALFFSSHAIPAQPTSAFGGMLVQSMQGEVMRFFFLLSSILVTHLGMVFFDRRDIPKIEFFHTVLIITAGLMLLVQANHFVMLFVALETVTVGFYVLVSYFRTSIFSLEAGIKYLILGAFSSSILLFGIVLIYGAGGNPAFEHAAADPMDFGQLAAFLDFHRTDPIALVGACLVIGGIAFKIGAVPFQIWIPDVYQGAPTPVTAFLAVASKAGGFLILINLVSGPFQALAPTLVPVLSVMAAATILFGNFAAVGQANLKRLMGLSGIAHAGYMLVGVIAAFYVTWAGAAVIFYLFTYLLASFAVFAVMTHLGPEDDTRHTMSDYDNLARRNPFLGATLSVALASLAGIPPLAGFIGKLLIFIVAFKAKLYFLLAVSVVGVVISIYYYFGWIMTAVARVYHADGETSEDLPASPLRNGGLTFAQRVILGSLTAVTVILGFYQGALSFLIKP